MKHVLPIETRSAEPFETREDNAENTDDIAGAVRAVNELRAAVEQHRTATEQRISDELRSLTGRIDTIDVRTQRPNSDPGTRENAAAERRAFLTYLRRGPQADDISTRALVAANGPQAGFLAPTEIATEMIRDLTEISPIRQYATVRQSMAGTVQYPKRSAITNAKWEGEIEESEESAPAFGTVDVVSHRLTTFVDISQSLMMGSDSAAEAETRTAFSEDFAAKEGAAFVSGNGVNAPLGLLSAPDVGYYANGHATNLSTDSLIKMMYSLQPAYRRSGVWLANGTTLAVIRTMKDTAGQYLWQPSVQAGQPETLLGRPIVEAIDMPDIAANAFPIIFADLGRGYRIVDRLQLAVLSDVFTQARRGIIRMHGTIWVGGSVVQPKAIKKLKMSVS